MMPTGHDGCRNIENAWRYHAFVRLRELTQDEDGAAADVDLPQVRDQRVQNRFRLLYMS